MSEQPPPLPQKQENSRWIVDALMMSLDARPDEVDPARMDSAICNGCRRDISNEVGHCPYCGLERPERQNLTSADFVPLCSDCGYDLSGLADGRCPECNKYFEVERLRIAWAVSRGTATSQYDNARGFFIGGLVCCLLCSFIAGTYPTFCVVLAASLIIPAVHYKVCPNIAVQGGHILLLAILPIAFCALHISLHRNPAPGQVACLFAAIGLSLFSLWAAPLKSSLVIATAITLPMFLIGGMYLLDGLVAKQTGSSWSTLEAPVKSKFAVIRAEDALLGGTAVCGTALLLTALAGVFSRRILLQLRSQGKLATYNRSSVGMDRQAVVEPGES